MEAYSLCEDTQQCGDVIDERTSTYIGEVETVQFDGGYGSDSVDAVCVLEVSYCVVGWTADENGHNMTDDIEDSVVFDIMETSHVCYYAVLDDGLPDWSDGYLDDFKEEYDTTWPLMDGFYTTDEAYKAMIRMASEDESWKMQ